METNDSRTASGNNSGTIDQEIDPVRSLNASEPDVRDSPLLFTPNSIWFETTRRAVRDTSSPLKSLEWIGVTTHLQIDIWVFGTPDDQEFLYVYDQSSRYGLFRVFQ
jgi:hypothetical protein